MSKGKKEAVKLMADKLLNKKSSCQVSAVRKICKKAMGYRKNRKLAA